MYTKGLIIWERTKMGKKSILNSISKIFPDIISCRQDKLGRLKLKSQQEKILFASWSTKV